MANPPITIGPFDNVPAQGSPIRSNWPQEISTVVTEMLRRYPRAKFAAGIGASSGGNLPNMQVMNWTADELPVPGLVLFWVLIQVNMTTGTTYQISTVAGAGAGGGPIAKQNITTIGANNVRLSGQIAVPGGAALMLQTRGDGTANIQTFTDNAANRMDALYVPNLYVPT